MLILSLQFKVTWEFKCSIPALSFAKKLFPIYTGEKRGYRLQRQSEGAQRVPSPLKGSLHEHKRCCCRDPAHDLTVAINYNYSGFSPTLHLIKSHHVLLPREYSCSFAHLWSGLSQTFPWDQICFPWQAGFPSDQPVIRSPHSCTSCTKRGQS